MPVGAADAGAAQRSAVHDFAMPAADVAAALIAADMLDDDALGETRSIHVELPADAAGVRPSDRLAGLLGEIEPPSGLELAPIEIPSIALRNDRALAAVLRLEDRGPSEQVVFGHTLPFWIAVARFVIELLVDQRFIPTLLQPREGEGELTAAWRPWLHDEFAQTRVAALLLAMPPVVRAVVNSVDTGDHRGDASWRILCAAIEILCDATVRRALAEAGFIDAIEDRDAATDPQVAWLGGLLGRHDAVTTLPSETAPDASPEIMLRDAHRWLTRLEDAERVRPFRLGFRLTEPPPTAGGPDHGLADGAETAPWRLDFQLLLEGEPPIAVDAERIWAGSPSAQVIDGQRLEQPQEMLLAELGRASRIYDVIERALGDAHPVGIDLTTREAARFLREHRQVLDESGFGVSVPDWWGRPSSRLGVRLQIDSPPESARGPEPGPTATASAQLGLDSLVRFRWEIAVGDEPLTAEQLRQIAQSAAPLLRVGDRWIENPAEHVARAAAFVEREPGGQITLREAIRLAQRADAGGLSGTGLPVLGMDAHGWVGRVLDADGGSERLPDLGQPSTFVGELRPYQKTGLSWLVFLEQFGFGACLADDMGLGKTIQLIALLLHERLLEPDPGPTLLVVPTSLIGNWVRELGRFSPQLKPHVHHGPQRPLREAFVTSADDSDIVITTYALVPRDLETISMVPWRRVVLDEAQYIKNPPTRQASAIRQLRAERRVALTGTPIENRLSELWSIMEFCNPGYLGPAEEFRRRCAVPIERHRDRERAESLRRLVHPFVLRRLKTDPKVISDLPACVQTKEFATLTAEQAALYQATVDELLTAVDEAEGIQRRGRVLAALTRLKQICNHPAQHTQTNATPASLDAHGSLSSRSGKCKRLIVLLEELLAEGDRALVFTQYRQMGHLLSAMIRQDLDCEPLFMHGGTPASKRQAIIDRFQAADGPSPVFILSLKTGGVGLNLTAANHVFHFDRWWNPAVENQATDRAFRIGQTRTVHVHKFICAGTLEERIDQMIEQKTELAQNIISSGEHWITELSTQRLHEILQLRAEAMEVES
ncbi:MAG: DEAD/DEAH box helicase [Planctomycetota bacterium]